MAQVVKNLPANAGDSGLIPGLGRSPREGNGSLLQFHSLENSMDRGAKWAVQSKGSQRSSSPYNSVNTSERSRL